MTPAFAHSVLLGCADGSGRSPECLGQENEAVEECDITPASGESLPLLYPADGREAATDEGAEEQQNRTEGRQPVEDLHSLAREGGSRHINAVDQARRTCNSTMPYNNV